MGRHILIAMALLLLGLAIVPFLPRRPQPTMDTPEQVYPWQIRRLADGSTEVFGLIPGRSTLEDAEARLGPDPALAVFSGPDRALSLEAYFERVGLGGLRANMVLTLHGDQRTLEAMAQRGRKAPAGESPGWRITLTDADRALARHAVIEAITYLPAVNLDKDIARQRFGEPAERIDVGEDVSHWLYPRRGLDLILDGRRKEVLQYVHPADFHRLRAPLADLAHEAEHAAQ